MSSVSPTSSKPSLIQRVGHYLSLVKFSHTVFALPFALVGFVLGIVNQHADWHWTLFVKMLLCMVFARSAAMAFNRWLDRHYDALNPRTAKREIPAGIVQPKNALLFTIVCCLAFVVVTASINQTVFFLSPVALFVVLFYSYTKRFTALCHLVLGAGLALAPVGAYLCVVPQFSWLPVVFSGIVLSWVGGFDIIYALQDIDFDRSQKLHSIPARLGLKSALLTSTILHLMTAVLVIVAGLIGGFHFIYWLGAALFIGLLSYQHLIVKPNDLSRVNIAFANTNGIASILFATVTVASLLLPHSL